MIHHHAGWLWLCEIRSTWSKNVDVCRNTGSKNKNPFVIKCFVKNKLFPVCGSGNNSEQGPWCCRRLLELGFASTTFYVKLINHENISFTGILIHELLIGKPPFRGKDQMQTYNLILRGIDCIQLSQKIPKKASLIIKRLCRQVGMERLGVQKNGIKDVKSHHWFSEFDWERLQARKMPAPLVLPVESNVDLSNFEEYPMERDETPDETSGWDCDF